jgi:hypothetical protein
LVAGWPGIVVVPQIHAVPGPDDELISYPSADIREFHSDGADPDWRKVNCTLPNHSAGPERLGTTLPSLSLAVSRCS